MAKARAPQRTASETARPPATPPPAVDEQLIASSFAQGVVERLDRRQGGDRVTPLFDSRNPQLTLPLARSILLPESMGAKIPRDPNDMTGGHP